MQCPCFQKLVQIRVVWNKIDTIVVDVVLKHQRSSIEELRKFKNPQNFFVLHRMDVVLNNKVRPLLLSTTCWIFTN